MKNDVFKFDCSDWLTGKIQLLSAVEKGIYIDLVARIWNNGGSIANDAILHRLLRVDKATLGEALQTFIDLDVMYEENGVLRVKFIDEQLSAAQAYREKQAEFGKRGAQNKKGAQGYPKATHNSKKATLAESNNNINNNNNITQEEFFKKEKEKIQKEKKEIADLDNIFGEDTIPIPDNYKRWSLADFTASVDQVITGKPEYQEHREAFIRYWSEPDPKGKMRFSLQRTWLTAGRLATWAKNAGWGSSGNNNNNGNNNNGNNGYNKPGSEGSFGRYTPRNG